MYEADVTTVNWGPFVNKGFMSGVKVLPADISHMVRIPGSSLSTMAGEISIIWKNKRASELLRLVIKKSLDLSRGHGTSVVSPSALSSGSIQP